MLAANTPHPPQDAIPLPVLEDYDVSPKTGFVPYPQPLARLTQPYFAPWEEIMDQLNVLIDSRQLRARVDQLPLLDVSRLETKAEHKRAYVLLSIMAHSYVWGSGLDIAQSIPAPLAVPWQAAADLVEIYPVLTYASSNLWNWKLKDPQGTHAIENLDALSTMTGTSDETWFLIVSIAIEAEGGAALQFLLNAMHAARKDDVVATTVNLKAALTRLEPVGKLLARMFEKCDPAVFYWKIRKYLSGSENAAGLGLPNGLEYKGVNNNERKHLMGSTGGQTSLFPALDLIFGIDHHEPGSSAETKTPNALMLKMKNFMPGPHRDFLDHLAKVTNLRAYVRSKVDSEQADEQTKELIATYDACVHQIKLFRDTHIQVVTRYVMTQAKRDPPEGWEDYRVQVSKELPKKEENRNEEDQAEPSIKGTGGSDLMPFLKGSRDDTNAAKLQTAARQN
ncbi:Indoleamine 2,3-dioxygenase [Gamsiella multidivaricata]|uniref:Indoleamine 2,3-dioxygenase n=1 Tax=Gamsiella multidivaricata TaxID=101098 RepID=UPI00221EC67A|nr:Indoleamine 2,3-dioxygenase [Gamsiella multidivaricata]KAG0360432.1 hypothetical protein BGZ54_009564 [Gamsiella multidivaricata]KAI7818100.1 Indoleamine 2,3-dioxygenase [Gamsiella multidivaricata]